MSRMKSIFWTRTDWHTRTGLYWTILREGEGAGCWLMWMEGRGYLDGLRFRHSWSDTEAWPVRCYKRYIPHCRPYHPLPVKYEDDRVSERNQWEKSEILVCERNQRGVRNVSKIKLAKELFTHLKGLPIFGYFIYLDDKTLLWVLFAWQKNQRKQ